MIPKSSHKAIRSQCSRSHLFACNLQTPNRTDWPCWWVPGRWWVGWERERDYCEYNYFSSGVRKLVVEGLTKRRQRELWTCCLKWQAPLPVTERPFQSVTTHPNRNGLCIHKPHIQSSTTIFSKIWLFRYTWKHVLCPCVKAYNSKMVGFLLTTHWNHGHTGPLAGPSNQHATSGGFHCSHLRGWARIPIGWL